jgi:hypothetical protein
VPVDLLRAAKYCGKQPDWRMSMDYSTMDFVHLMGREFCSIEVKLSDVLEFWRSA